MINTEKKKINTFGDDPTNLAVALQWIAVVTLFATLLKIFNFSVSGTFLDVRKIAKMNPVYYLQPIML